MSPLAFYAAQFVALYLGIYLAAVFQVRRKLALNAFPQFEPRSLAGMPASVRARFEREVPRLEASGFVVVDYLHHAGLAHARSDAFVALLKNEESGDLAMVTEIFVQVGRGPKSVGLVAFTTELAGGRAVSTTNSSQVPAFKPDERRMGFRFPGVGDPRFLYRVHRALLARHAPGERGVLPSAGMEIPYLCEVEARASRRQVECGYFRLDEARGLCVHTWKGALIMTVKQMYGVKNLLRAAMRRRARLTLRSLGLSAA